MRSQRAAPLSAKNLKISQSVRSKFLILLLLTLALMFDIFSRQPGSEIFDNQSLPEISAVR